MGYSPVTCHKFLLVSLLLTILISLNLPASAAYLNEDCRCKDITPEQMWKADAWLWLSSADKEAALNTHLPWGVPTDPAGADHESHLIQRDYIIDYDGDLRDPLWVAYKLTRSDLSVDRNRTECFRQDIRVSYEQASTCADYSEPTYDQGHMAPNADFTRSLQAMLNTYIMSNMTPQECAFNRGTWLIMESLVRKWVEAKGTLYVISGSVFDRDGTLGRDPDNDAKRMKADDESERVAIPSAFYKILVHRNPGGSLESLSLLVPHTAEKIADGEPAQRQYLIDHLVSIDDIEQRTGIEFFPDMVASDPAAAMQFKTNKANSLWDIDGSWPSRMDALCQ